jgi:hypothetical protein
MEHKKVAFRWFALFGGKLGSRSVIAQVKASDDRFVMSGLNRWHFRLKFAMICG